MINIKIILHYAITSKNIYKLQEYFEKYRILSLPFFNFKENQNKFRT